MMKKINFVLMLLMVTSFLGLQAQQKSANPALKGDGTVFYYEDFNWENPADPKGWTMPAGYMLLDPDDNGFNFQWLPYDSLNSILTSEPPFNSTTGHNGYLGLFLSLYNNDKDPRLTINNSIQFPHFDCSQHSSVVVRYETHFMNGGPGLQLMQVSADGGAHWATYNVGFGVNHKDRPNDVAPGKPAIYEANISDVAAGQTDVIIRLHWGETTLYFWVLDDFSLAEAYDNDLRLKHFTAEWDNGDVENPMTPFNMIPKSQLNGTGGFFNFESSVQNFGEFDQEDVYLDLNITKNNEVIWHKETTPLFLVPTFELDTIKIADKFMPVDFGHYKVSYNYKQSQLESTPENNKAEFFFNVNDSVFSRSDDSPDLAWSYLFERYGNIEVTAINDYFTGSIFPIAADCEVSSLSTYIMGGLADGKIEYQFQIWKVPVGQADETPFKILTSEMAVLDSSQFNTWVTLPFDKDGESEFLKAGDLIYAGISQWDNHEDYMVRRSKSLKIGTDRTLKMVGPTAVGLYDGNIELGLGTFVRRNLMCRLNLNDHSNITDGTDITRALTSLGQNYPNPFNSTTEISFELANGSDVSIEVMDMTGRKILDRAEGFKPAGKHSMTLDAAGLEAGIYYYSLKAGQFKQTKQMVIY
ncbi:MAG: T9SS C-terminal target domain-containing protein [Porphyromonadaceae bacterium]|nr:MAG: T9SS C-terminal target domain-containing protein [Porphyromonadaceae bacterium]